ncbi:MAG: flagellar biosynthesis protein FliQ [Aliivibrio sp.]|uniref:flagellar biosynthesis protein FliQ n=1 Tax=Aliivibrio sp. TaxID=1872443 RepID=UPI001A57F22F|nr:flagellar biosynthesis protein FliQ [Aliivibrio sp.]
MTPEVAIEIFRGALYIVLLLVCAIIVPSLMIGLVVAVFQAATSINEQTLSFLPRLIVTILVLMFFGHWMTRIMTEYFLDIVARIPLILY